MHETTLLKELCHKIQAVGTVTKLSETIIIKNQFKKLSVNDTGYSKEGTDGWYLGVQNGL